MDLIEDYFAQPEEELKKDERPELGYQIGVTLENTEKPKCAVDEPCLKIIEMLEPSERPLDITAHAPDPKCRFFWKMGETPPYDTEFPGLNASKRCPRGSVSEGKMAFDNGEMGDLYEKRVCRIFHLFHLIILTRIFRLPTLPIWWPLG